MTEMLQAILLHPILIALILLGVFLFITRLSLVQLKEYPGYGLGLLIGLFFMVVYISLGGDADPNLEPENVRQTLNIFEVFIATFFGLFFGAIIIVALRFGTHVARGVSLQVAIYTALSFILLFLTIIAGPITQRMIGIFALAIGIASLFAMVLFPDALQDMQKTKATSAQAVTQGDTGRIPAQAQTIEGASGSRLDAIRQKMEEKKQ